MEVCGAGAHHDQETPDHVDTCAVDMVILLDTGHSGNGGWGQEPLYNCKTVELFGELMHCCIWCGDFRNRKLGMQYTINAETPHKISALFPWKNIETKSKNYTHLNLCTGRYCITVQICFYFQLLTECSCLRTDRARSAWCSRGGGA